MWLGLVEPIGTGLIAENLYVIRTGYVNFYIYTEGADCVAFDSGANERVIRRELAVLGLTPDDVSAVFLSHSDFDHVGGLPVFRNASVYMSHDEEQLITRGCARKFGLFYNKGISKIYSLLKRAVTKPERICIREDVSIIYMSKHTNRRQLSAWYQRVIRESSKIGHATRTT